MTIYAAVAAYAAAENQEARDLAFQAIMEHLAYDPDLDEAADLESGAEAVLEAHGLKRLYADPEY